MTKRTQNRATSISNFLNMKFELIEFPGEWYLAFGTPERTGIWYIGGRPTSGKTSFVIQLIRAFAELDMRVRFYNWEEQYSLSMQQTLERFNIQQVATRGRVVMINNRMGYKELIADIESTRNDVIVIDSIQKSGISAKQVESMRDKFSNKLLVFTSHVQPNGLPDKQPANQVYREASQKIFTEGYRAISNGRSFGERGYYNIWKEKADAYWAVVE